MMPGKEGFRWMIINPTDDLTLDCYVDSKFTGLWGQEDSQDSLSIKSITGFVLALGTTPILWVSKLQIEISCTTMEAENIALAHIMRELLPTK
eukprot:2622524-Ditylum_brightwellii.AAC.1